MGGIFEELIRIPVLFYFTVLHKEQFVSDVGDLMRHMTDNQYGESMLFS